MRELCIRCREDFREGFMEEGGLEWTLKERKGERAARPERQRQEKAWPIEGKVMVE